jgi:flavin reductase (DIM6/NTAB) family NADH-FMN oxidoreductase RutF
MTDATPLRDQFLHAMSRCAATVSVVTTDGPAGRAGVTVSAMTSVSADGPAPTILVCVNDGASAAAPILENGCFGVNVLGADQQAVSDVFAGRGGASGAARFDAVGWQAGAAGAPLIDGALAAFECRLISADLVGTHYVMIGAVQSVRVAEQGTPLIYGMRRYLRAETA